MSLIDALNDEQKRQTSHVIATVGTEVIITRPADYVDDGAGGKHRPGPPTTLPAKRYWVSGVSADHRFTSSETGQRVQGDYVIVGMPEDDIRKGDEFIYNGIELRVRYVDRFPWQVRGICVYASGGNG